MHTLTTQSLNDPNHPSIAQAEKLLPQICATYKPGDNPYETLYHKLERTMGSEFRWQSFTVRRLLTKYFGFAVPSTEAIKWISNFNSIVEMGAGSGYWSRLIHDTGCEIQAFDNRNWKQDYWAYNWFNVMDGEPELLATHKAKALLLCWPNYNDPFADECLEHWKGEHLIFVGEGQGGCTADDSFFHTLEKHWALKRRVYIPTWPGIHDQMEIYQRR